MKILVFYVFPIAVSALMHALMLGLLMANWEKSEPAKKVVTPKYIQAKLVELNSKSAKKATAQKKPKIVDLTAKRREDERKKRLTEQKRQQDIQKKKQAEAKKTAEKKKREIEERKRKEQEQQLAEQRRRQEMQQEFEEALKEEDGLLQEDQYATDAASYADAIRLRIEQNWSRPPSARNGMRSELTIDLVPNGRIVDVNIKTSSGNLAFDRSALAAVKKVEVFPEVKDIPVEVFERHFRKFTLAFQPEDLRQ